MKYITVESDSRWTQKKIFDIPDGSFVVEEGLFSSTCWQLRRRFICSKYLARPVSILSSVSRGITSVLINAKMKKYVCFGKYNTSLIPWVCIYDFVGFNLRLWRNRVAAFSISRCHSTRPSHIFYFQHFFIKIKYSIVLNLVFHLTGTIIVFL